MKKKDVTFKIRAASREDIYSHLLECNDQFIPPLNKKTDIHEYARKIFEKAVTFEAWSGPTLAGIIAAYFNDVKNKKGFITNVSTIKTFEGRGIASELLNRCIAYARKNKFTEITLQVSKASAPAIHLYKKKKFIIYESKDEFIFMKLILPVGSVVKDNPLENTPSDTED